MTKTRDRINEYYARQALSQSKLKLLINRPKDFIEDRQVHSDAMLLGSIVDMMVTCPELSYKYVPVDDAVIPDNSIKTILEAMAKDREVLLQDLNDLNSVIVKYCERYKYRANYRDSTKLTKIKEGRAYWKLLQSCGSDGMLVSRDMYDKAVKIYDSICMSYPTMTKSPFSKKHTDLFQTPIYFGCMGEECKALIDIIKVSDDEVHVIDVKTTGGTLRAFPEAFMRLRYDIQAAFYKEAVMSIYGAKNIKVSFLVQSTIDIEEPLLIGIEESILHAGKYGDERSGMKGFVQLIDDYKYYMEHGFSMHRDLHSKRDNLVLSMEGGKCSYI